VSTYRRSPSALHRTAGPDVMATLPRDREIHVLSGAAVPMWHLLEREASVEDVVTALAEAYATPPATIDPDVRRCLDDLADRGLVERRDA
jgi:Coenzyme PQQ synthesis protein D (PqqD)